METIKLSARPFRKQALAKIEKDIQKNELTPNLTLIKVGNDPASEIYVKHKQKTCREIGINSTIIEYEESISEDKLLSKIKKLNKDKSVNGILVQLPLPKHIDASKVIESVDPEKDVDGFHPTNIGKNVLKIPAIKACTPKGIMSLLKFYKINITGLHCVIVGRSNIVGKPLINMLLNNNATVTVCHSKTENLKDHTKKADILIVAVGKAHFIDRSMIKRGAIIIDVGINKLKGKTVGDVDYSSCETKAIAISPVPGGVGLTTVVSLMENTILCTKAQLKK